jgi:hypothetical protein
LSWLEVLIGPIAAGKSTYARKRADEGAIVVSHDDLTTMCHTRYRYEQGLRECYRRMEESIAWAAIAAGRDVVVDRTHLTRESRERWVRWARLTYDALNTYEGRGPTTRVIAVAFPIEAPEIHARRRGRTYLEWLRVAHHHADQAATEPLADDEGFAEIVRAPGVAR